MGLQSFVVYTLFSEVIKIFIRAYKQLAKLVLEILIFKSTFLICSVHEWSNDLCVCVLTSHVSVARQVLNTYTDTEVVCFLVFQIIPGMSDIFRNFPLVMFGAVTCLKCK